MGQSHPGFGLPASLCLRVASPRELARTSVSSMWVPFPPRVSESSSPVHRPALRCPLFQESMEPDPYSPPPDQPRSTYGSLAHATSAEHATSLHIARP